MCFGQIPLSAIILKFSRNICTETLYRYESSSKDNSNSDFNQLHVAPKMKFRFMGVMYLSRGSKVRILVGPDSGPDNVFPLFTKLRICKIISLVKVM